MHWTDQAKMPEYWVVCNNCQEECYNIYSSEARAREAVQLMRERYGEYAGHFDPYIVGKVAEGVAFGEGVLVDGLRQQEQDMILD